MFCTTAAFSTSKTQTGSYSVLDAAAAVGLLQRLRRQVRVSAVGARRRRSTATAASCWSAGTGTSRATGASGSGTAVVMVTTTTSRRRPTVRRRVGVRRRRRRQRQPQQDQSRMKMTPSRKVYTVSRTHDGFVVFRRYSHLSLCTAFCGNTSGVKLRSHHAAPHGTVVRVLTHHPCLRAVNTVSKVTPVFTTTTTGWESESDTEQEGTASMSQTDDRFDVFSIVVANCRNE